MPVRVRVPAPLLVREMAFEPSAITPSNWVLAPLDPAVRVTSLAPELVTVPVPARPSMATEKPFTSRVPGPLMVTLEAAEMPVALPMARVPVLMAVGPE